MRVNVGVVGCGDIAIRSYLPDLQDSEVVRLVAAADVVPNRVEAACKKFGIPKSYTSYEELLKDSQIDLVLILTPIPMHFDMVREALLAGKNVYVEKPLAMTNREANELIELANKKGLLLSAAPSTILSQTNQIVKQLIDKDAIGTICFSRAHGSHQGAAWSPFWTTDPSWFFKKGSGPLYDMGVYQFHLMTYLMGPAKKVTAMSRLAIPVREIRSGPAKGKVVEGDVDDCTLLIMEMANGSFSVVDATFCVRSYKGPTVEIYGSGGTININREQPRLEVYQDDHDTNISGWRIPWQKGPDTYRLARGVEHVATALIEKRAPLVTAEHAAHVVELMEKAYISAETGQTMRIESSFSSTYSLRVWEEIGANKQRSLV